MDILTVPLSALQHYAFCRRQCAIIYNEWCWEDNYLTAIGSILHERVDSGVMETRRGIRYERTVKVSSEKYNLIGVLDLLECGSKPYDFTPVEYKKGKPKKDYTDAVQLCGGALCIEEMLCTTVKIGAIWYWGIRRRVEIPIDEELRAYTIRTIDEVKDLFTSGDTPKAEYSKKCNSCSLYGICFPKILDDNSTAYINELLRCES
ncbi:MAG: CRISPR-associated protein Cas4 [Deferribacteraceae bacterium]|jgi:CRISPR-associated exonuclease Cas4|nr:CRISPR-associated protein Cas4 [Deferribacteraceae bacterium]